MSFSEGINCLCKDGGLVFEEFILGDTDGDMNNGSPHCISKYHEIHQGKDEGHEDEEW